MNSCGGCELKVNTKIKKKGKEQLYLDCQECIKSCGAKVRPKEFYIQKCIDVEGDIAMDPSGQLICQKLVPEDELKKIEAEGGVEAAYAKKKSAMANKKEPKRNKKFDLKNIDPKIFNAPHSEF